MMGTLYIVPTPIGNLEDITLRAIKILSQVDLVLCEDTRVTHRLLSHHKITVATSQFFAQSPLHKIDEVCGMLRGGKNLALVSDAGTPTISDPGVLLVDEVRKRAPEARIIALPGATALTTALPLSGISSAEFTFLGFLPHKKGRETLFREIAESTRTVVFYESVHRIEKALLSLEGCLAATRRIAVARELTKIHEECVRGTSSEVVQYFKDNHDKIRGEFVVIVEAA